MENIRSLKINTYVSVLNRLVRLLAGIIIPRLIISNYGSSVNGLYASIDQFLSVITFLDLGVGAVIQSALYGPLANKDSVKVNQIYYASKQYFKKIAYFLVIYLVILIVIFPYIIGDEFSNQYVAMLIIMLSLNRFSQYYFGIVNELLLNADQKLYVQLIYEIIVVILGSLLTVLLIINNVHIILVAGISTLVYSIRPLMLNAYVKKHYQIEGTSASEKDPLPQKWNGAVQHIASVLSNSLSVVLLTILSSLEYVSVYSVYYMVISGIRMFITTMTSGLQSFFGNLIALNKVKEINSHFDKLEWFIHNFVILLFSLTGTLIVPFVMIYVQIGEGSIYFSPIFALTLVVSQILFALRIPYYSVIKAAGHFKETQRSAIVEIIINIIFSLMFMQLDPLIGVAMGSLLSYGYRLLYYIAYLEKNIIFRSKTIFMKRLSVDVLILFLCRILSEIINIQVTSFKLWVISAIFLTIVYLIILFVVNFVFYREETQDVLKIIIKKR